MTFTGILPALLAVLGTGVPAAPARAACPLPPGWQKAADLRPARGFVGVWNTATQSRSGQWRWNKVRISEPRLFEYLRINSTLTPLPVAVFTFSSRLSCDEKQRLQTLIVSTDACGPDSKPCVEGSDRDYRSALFPGWHR